jgi:hypothetical protein
MASILDALTVSDAGTEKDKRFKTAKRIADAGKEIWGNMNLLEKAALATAPIPILGDVTGLASDAYMYATNPEERTPLNAGLSLLGMLPLIPSASATRKVTEAGFEIAGPKGPIKATVQPRSKEVVGEAPMITDVKKRQDRIANKVLDVARTQYDAPQVPLTDYSGHPVIWTMSDRTPSNDVVYGVNDVEFKNPVYLDGGDTFGMNQGLDEWIWANDSGAVSAIVNRAMSEAEKTGKSPLLAKFVMAPSSVDFPTMAPKVHIEYANATLNSKEKKFIEKMIKYGGMVKVDNSPAPAVPGFSFDMENMDEFLKGLSGPQRKAINNLFDAVSMLSKQGASRGLVELPTLTNEQMRAVITKPEHLNRTSMGEITTLSMLDGTRGPSAHSTYDTGMGGQTIGTVRGPTDSPLTLWDALNVSNPELLQKSTPNNLWSTDMYTIRKGVKNNVLTDEVLKGMGY